VLCLPIPMPPSKNLSVLCVGAHSDDIEIGCGGTVLQLLQMIPSVRIHWVVFSSNAARRREAVRSARLFLKGARSKRIVVHSYKDGFFPYQGAKIKRGFEHLKTQINPDLIFTHYRHDLHQDHRLLNELTWNTFRGHLILEYEIPKYDGDLGSPNVFVPLEESICRLKATYLDQSFETQRTKRWFSEGTFFALLRLRGVEAASPTRFAEAFYGRKINLEFSSKSRFAEDRGATK
jgi:LmbE family N-acetylglucosaminyl deacetylase